LGVIIGVALMVTMPANATELVNKNKADLLAATPRTGTMRALPLEPKETPRAVYP